MHKEILKLFPCVSHLIYHSNIFHILVNIFQTGSSAALNKMTFEQTPGGSGPGSPPEEEEDAGEVVTMVDVLKDGRDMEENAKVLNSIVAGLHYTQKCQRTTNVCCSKCRFED